MEGDASNLVYGRGVKLAARGPDVALERARSGPQDDFPNARAGSSCPQCRLGLRSRMRCTTRRT